MTGWLIVYFTIGIVYFGVFIKMIYNDNSVTVRVLNNNKRWYVMLFILFLLTGGLMVVYDLFVQLINMLKNVGTGWNN